MKSLPPLMVELARLSKSFRLVTNTTGVFLCAGKRAQLGAELEAVHARHVHVEEDQVEPVLRQQVVGAQRDPRR